MGTCLESKWEEVIATLTEPRYKKHLNSYPKRNTIKMIKLPSVCWAGHVACVGEEENVYRILERKRNGKRPH